MSNEIKGRAMAIQNSPLGGDKGFEFICGVLEDMRDTTVKPLQLGTSHDASAKMWSVLWGIERRNDNTITEAEIRGLQRIRDQLDAVAHFCGVEYND